MKLYSFFSILMAVVLVACKGNADEQKTESDERLIPISQKQYVAGQMSIGELEMKVFDETVHCHGNIITKPGGTATISTTVSGLVKRIFCSPGQKVTSGQAILEITGNELIELQKDLAETSSLLVRVRSDYERLRSLYAENVGSEKDLIFAESEFKSAQAEYSALKMKIQLLGLDPAQVEKGTFSESFTIKSPINGYISLINVKIGQYADPQTIIAEVFDASMLYLRIAVFEKDLARLKLEQAVLFRLLGNSLDYTATLSSIGRNIDTETKTILCLAEIEDLGKANFVSNAYIEARIVTKTDTVVAIPEEAIVRSGGNNYIFLFEQKEGDTYYFSQRIIEAGRSVNGYVEILNPPDDRKVLTSGAYNIPVE